MSEGGLRGAVAFLTPIGGAAAPGPSSLWWFPVVGAGIGAAVGGVWWAADRAFPLGVAAALAVIADLVFTGLLHIDGLCDSADGLIAPMDQSRRLEVMAAPDVGAFGVATCVAVMLLRWTALASVHPRVLAVVVLWTLSRTAMAVVALTVPYARPGGLATAFAGAGSRARGVQIGASGVVLALAVAVVDRPLADVVAATAACVGVVAVVALAGRRIGGYTGDVLGALGVVGETVGLVVIAAKW